MEYYSIEDFKNVKKADVHVHINTFESVLLEQADEDNFKLLTINADAYPEATIEEQQQKYALSLLERFSQRIAYLTTFRAHAFEEQGLKNSVMSIKCSVIFNLNFSPGNVKTAFLSLLLLLSLNLLSFGHTVVNDLRSQGFSLIPAPQKTVLSGKTIEYGHNWSIDSKLKNGSNVLQLLHAKAKELHGIDFSGNGKDKIVLDINPQILDNSVAPELAAQGYFLEMTSGLIKITGSSENGLFYGVQSVLQLLKQSYRGGLLLPEGTITDWPDLELRIIHWDTKHHQNRIETLKRYIDQSAYFKANAIAIEIEDKYEYPSHPVIGAPGAYTKAQMQDLTKYAKDRFIQLVPMVQAPAHLAYVLKHKEFAHLKSDGSNYQICMCDEEAIQLIFDMYQDMIDATPGVEYFLVSTDEIYFAGVCSKCKNEYNDENRSQAWVDFAKRANNFISKHGRKMISWVEYPLLPEYIQQLPADMIDGVISTGKEQQWLDEEKKRGIRGLVYNSVQGSEYLFPNYFPTNYRNVQIEGNLRGVSASSKNAMERGAYLMGTFTAAWDDSGLHDELFWLGWATGLQYSWTIGEPAVEQTVADFMDVFYGYGSPQMVEVYRLLEDGARFYQDLWDNVISKEREPGYGDWYGIGVGTERYDQTLETLPSPEIVSEPVFRIKYAKKIKKATVAKRDNERLISLLMHSLSEVKQNRYNIEVMLSVAYLEQYTINTLLNWVKVENYLVEASKVGEDYSKAVNNMVEAYNLAGEILKEENETGKELKYVWEESRFEKCRSVDGRDFVHVLDDLKDHFADRRTSLKHMTAPFERMEIDKWQKQLLDGINAIAKTHKVSVTGLKEEPLNE